LTITDFGIDGDGNPFLTVKGTAGGTVPDEKGDIYAYVFFTDDGIYAVTSHPGIEDSDADEQETTNTHELFVWHCN